MRFVYFALSQFYVERLRNEEDARSYKIALSQMGKDLFDNAFPAHLEYLRKPFSSMPHTEISKTIRMLKSIELEFTKAKKRDGKDA